MPSQTGSGTVKVLGPESLTEISAIVTGAGSGIGRAISLRLVELGAHVHGLGRHVDSLEATKKMVRERAERLTFAACDVRDREAAATALVEAADQHGLDLLVNNAGGQFFAPAVDISARGWDAVIDLNLTSVFNLTKAAHPYLAASSGSVQNLSLSGVERGGMGLAHSIAARSGVLGLTRTLALEWAKDGIRLNCIGPGTVITTALGEEASQHVLGNLVQKATPMQRETPVEDVAELVAFLASPAGALMTGQLIQIDGGAHLGRGLHMLPEAYV